MQHAPWGSGKNVPTDVAAVMRHPVYTREYMESIKPHHLPPKEVCTGDAGSSVLLRFIILSLCQTLMQAFDGVQ